MYQQTPPTFTLEEYLALDAASEHKWEYEAGHVYCLAGSTNDHATIVGNLNYALRQAIGNRRCRIMSESPKVIVSANKHYYPDLVVSCSDEGGRDTAVRAPLLIAEVLSPSTELRDKGTKLFAYQRVASIEIMLLIAPDEKCVTLYQRVPDDAEQWMSCQYRADLPEIPLHALEQSLQLADLYRYTSLETNEADRL